MSEHEPKPIRWVMEHASVYSETLGKSVPLETVREAVFTAEILPDGTWHLHSPKPGKPIPPDEDDD